MNDRSTKVRLEEIFNSIQSTHVRDDLTASGRAFYLSDRPEYFLRPEPWLVFRLGHHEVDKRRSNKQDARDIQRDWPVDPPDAPSHRRYCLWAADPWNRTTRLGPFVNRNWIVLYVPHSTRGRSSCGQVAWVPSSNGARACSYGIDINLKSECFPGHDIYVHKHGVPLRGVVAHHP